MPTPSQIMREGGHSSSTLLSGMAQAMGSNVTVLSATYKKRDASGNPVYLIRVKPTVGGGTATRLMTVTYSGGQIGKPNWRGSGVPDDPRRSTGGGVRTGDLEAAKDRWLATIARNPGGMSDFHKRNLIRAVNNYNGTADGLNQMMAQLYKSPNVIGVQGSVDEGTGAFDPFAGLNLGGGGGGFGGPEYRAPDRRVVEDMVSGILVSLTGASDPGSVKSLADLYMKDHRRNFDSQGAEISPEQSVLEAVRNTEQYRQIHQLRPEGQDERSWISNRRQAGAQGGLDTEELDEFAVEQATVGGDEADVQVAAGVQQLLGSGSSQGTLLDDRIRGVARAVFGGVR